MTIEMHPNMIEGYKRRFSKAFRISLIDLFIQQEINDSELIVIPTDLLKELCIEADLPPCYLLFENNVESDSTLIHNDDITDIRIR